MSIGGDAIIGSSYAELMPLFEADGQTQAIVIYTEPGGRMEAGSSPAGSRTTTRGCRSWRSWPAASWTRMPGMTFGHAGTIVEGKVSMSARKTRLSAADRCGGGDLQILTFARADRGERGACSPARNGIFIDVEVSDAAATRTPSLAKKLEEACPVDIFATADGGVEIVRANLDECVLCEPSAWRPPGGGARGEALRRRRGARTGVSPA